MLAHAAGTGQVEAREQPVVAGVLRRPDVVELRGRLSHLGEGGLTRGLCHRSDEQGNRPQQSQCTDDELDHASLPHR